VYKESYLFSIFANLWQSFCFIYAINLLLYKAGTKKSTPNREPVFWSTLKKEKDENAG
jgi:hypothetical protein